MDFLSFERIGLNKNEAIVYIELMKLGQATAGQLIKKTEFHRNIVYDNLEKLIDKGLVSYILEGKKKIFQVNPPEMLTDFLEKQQESLNKKKKIAQELKDEILKHFKIVQTKQEAVIYRGVKGIKLVMKDILETGKNYISFGAPEESNTLMGKTFWKNFSIKQKEKRIYSKLLFNLSLKYWGKQVSHKYNKIKYLENTIEPLTQTIVYGSKTAVIVWTEKPIITLINDENVAKSYTDFFDILWKTSSH
jgi:sugar-specific transcriptional regulator TrmB